MSSRGRVGPSRVTLDHLAARAQIVALWHRYERKPGANVDMEMGSFFRWLETDHPEALRFCFHSSKWDLVRGWLEHDDKVRKSIARATRL